jgi:hypothetical protein
MSKHSDVRPLSPEEAVEVVVQALTTPGVQILDFEGGEIVRTHTVQDDGSIKTEDGNRSRSQSGEGQ